MKGFLLDTNVLGRYFSGNQNVLSHVDALADDAVLYASVITLGEIHYGHKVTNSTNQSRRDEFERWVRNEFREPLKVTRHTAIHYADIKAAVYDKFPPQNDKSNHVELCYDHASGHELGVEENDLWIAAQAIERNLVLVSNDRMAHIREAIGKTLDLEDWEKP